MVNPLSINGQSTPDKQEGKPTERPSDNGVAENSQENLDARLDHAIEETFPTSDPVSVTITNGPEPDQDIASSAVSDQQDHTEQESTEEVLHQVREASKDVVGQASGATRDLYSRGEHYAQQEREQYPEAERYIREMPASRDPAGDGEPVACAGYGGSGRIRPCLDDPWAKARSRRTHPGLWPNRPGLRSPSGRTAQAPTTRWS
jgi:hypothetical protein